MKPVEIYVGLKVVVNDSPRAALYTVTKFDGKFKVELGYESCGRMWHSGVADVSMLSLPTIEQMANA
jgi:hypothetical protein